MLISTEEPLAQGDGVSCSFYLPGGSKVIAHGMIARVVKEGPGSKVKQYGVVFANLNAELKAAIEAFINREIQNRSESSPGMDRELVA
jgi:hypothetical protein